MRRAAARKRQLQERRRRNNDASRRWKEANPERVRTYHREWTVANRDKVNEYYRRYRASHREELNGRATAWRDSQPEKMKRARKAWADRNKERTAEIQRKRRSDPEKYRADLDANSAAKRLARRLERAGLPPKRLHRTTAAARRANNEAAEAYFDDPVLPEKVRQFTVFTVKLTEEVLTHGDRMLDFARSYVAKRARMGLSTLDPEQVMYARAVDIVVDRMRRVDLLTGREIAAAVRSAKTTVAAAVHERALKDLTQAVKAHVERDRARLVADADLENSIRTRRGKPRIPADLLVVRSALEEVIEASISMERSHDDVCRIAKQVESALLLRAHGNQMQSSQKPKRLGGEQFGALAR